jgi:hypothetical protein
MTERLGLELFLESGELCPVVGDENSEQTCRLGGTGVLADQVLAARRFEETLTCLVCLVERSAVRWPVTGVTANNIR